MPKLDSVLSPGKVNEWCLVDCFRREFSVFRLWQAFNGPSDYFFCNSKYVNLNLEIQTSHLKHHERHND